MLQGSIFAGSYADVEELFHGREVGDRGRGELPVLEGFVGEVAGVSSAVAAQNFGRIVGGIEADAEQVRMLVARRIGLQGLVDFGKVMTHAGTEIRERAASVDECHHDNLAAKLLEVDGVIGLVEQLEVGNLVAFGGYVVVDGWLVVGPRLSDDDDVLEAQIDGPGGIVIGEQGGGNEVSGMQFGEG